MAPFQISVDGWVEQLLKLGYGKEKHFKESVIVIDSLQNMASGQTDMVGSADSVLFKTEVASSQNGEGGWSIPKPTVYLDMSGDYIYM